MTFQALIGSWRDLVGHPSGAPSDTWRLPPDVVVPMSTAPIRKRQIATITSLARPFTWIAQQLYISSAGTRGGAADWQLHSIRVDGHEKLSAPISGAVFAVGEVWSDVCWKVGAQRRVVMEVEYVGRRKCCTFYASIVGLRTETRAVSQAGRSVEAMTKAKKSRIASHRACHHDAADHRARTATAKHLPFMPIGGSFPPPPGTLRLGVDRQPDGFTCGTETFQGICEFLRLPIAAPDMNDIESYKKKLHTSWKYGTDPSDIAKGARSYLGIEARVETLTVEDLDGFTRGTQSYVDALSKGKRPDRPLSIAMITYQAYVLPDHDKSLYFPKGRKKGPRKVLPIRREDGSIDWANDWSDGHWSAVVRVVLPREKKILSQLQREIGYRPRASEIAQGIVVLADPSNGEGLSFIPIPEFVARWHDTDRDDKPRFRQSAVVLTVPVPVLHRMQGVASKQGVPMFSTVAQNSVIYVP